MGEMNGITVWNVYQESQLRIKNGTSDYRDRVIVKQFEDSIKKNEKIAELKATILEKEKANGELTTALEIFHTRENLKIMGESNVGSYLKGLLDSKQLTELVH